MCGAVRMCDCKCEYPADKRVQEVYHEVDRCRARVQMVYPAHIENTSVA